MAWAIVDGVSVGGAPSSAATRYGVVPTRHAAMKPGRVDEIVAVGGREAAPVAAGSGGRSPGASLRSMSQRSSVARIVAEC
jgi:hypothetical protein